MIDDPRSCNYRHMEAVIPILETLARAGQLRIEPSDKDRNSMKQVAAFLEREAHHRVRKAARKSNR